MRILISLIFLLQACASPKKEVRTPSSLESPKCPGECDSQQVCMNTFTDKGAVCTNVPKASEIDFILPFDSLTEVVCTHSQGSGSHSGSNAYFALDLATDYSKSPAIVRASADGVAYVFQGCSTPKGTPAKSEVSDCGDSWGNHIRILHDNGYLSFYVHLEKALIKNGVFVRKGEVIGVEGSTGAAGHRHLHWSIQKLPGNSLKEWQSRITWAGESVPFFFRANQNGRSQIFDVTKIKCAHAGIGAASEFLQPRFRGVSD